jgi:oligopeptide transport system permease protein
MIAKSEVGSIGTTTIVRKTESLWKDAWRRLLRNRAAVLGLSIIALLILAAISYPLIRIKPFDLQVLPDQNKVPGWIPKIFTSMQGYAKINNTYPLGADYVGRDLFSRLVFGARISLTVAFVGPLISLLVGVTFGSISGYFGGRVDDIMMRLVDVLYTIPTLLFIILLMTFFRGTFSKPDQSSFLYAVSQFDIRIGGMLFIIVGIALTSWETSARLTRGQVLSIREKEFIEAARTVGASNWRIMFKHIMPNIIGPLIVNESLAIPGYITYEAVLSFIGLGVMPPTPSWGAMISDGSQVIRTYPNQTLFPALMLAITMFAFNFLGDGLRDALDPRMRGTS